MASPLSFSDHAIKGLSPDWEDIIADVHPEATLSGTGPISLVTGTQVFTQVSTDLASHVGSSKLPYTNIIDLASQSLIGRNTAGTGVQEALSASTVKTILSLNNVENTALSTWAGSANLITLGTVTTGTWHGSVIAATYLPTAAADGTTLGVAAFTAADFNASTGVISIDYTNGQAASGSVKGFLTSADWTTFNSKQAGDATLTALASYNTNGILTQTAADTFTGRTITGTANQIVVSNGNGVSGNPTLSTPQDIATGSSPTFSGLTLSSMTAGSVLFAGTSGVISQDNANLFWDDSNNRLGIGTTSPTKQLEIVGATGSASITPIGIVISSTTSAADWDSTNPWGVLDFYSADSTNPNLRARIGAKMSGAAGGSTDLVFYTTITPSSLNTLAMIMSATGLIGIGTTSPSNRLHVQSTTTPQDRIAYDSSNYITTTVSSAGVITFTPTGSAPEFVIAGKGSINSGSSTTARIGGVLSTDTSAVGNVGAGTDNLITYSVPAGTLANANEKIRYKVAGTFAANGNSKTVNIVYGATTLLTFTASYNGGSWEGEAEIVRTGAATQIATAHLFVTDATATNTGSISKYTTPAETLSGAVTIKCTASGTADNDISQKISIVEWIP